jgi:nucleoside-diphosphate-sugar epimerase
MIITGALGHIGSRLIRHIDGVVAIDNLSTLRYSSLFNLPKPVEFIESDAIKDKLDFSGHEVVVHLAAKTDAANSDNDTLFHNLEATRKVVDECKRVGAYLIYVSSTSVYGQAGGIVDEDSELNPQSPYAEAKILEESLLHGSFHCILRFGTIFGSSPGMRFHTAVNKFIWNYAHGLPVTVWRTALHQKRPYLDLSDAVEAIKFCSEKRPTGAYNVLTMNATVNDILSELPGSIIKYVDSPIMNQLSYEVSRKKFESLGFTFKGDIKKGIAETLRLLKGGK